jgi:hypothetical protein
MPIRRLTPDSAIADYIAGLVEEKTREIIDKMCYVGEQCLNQARSTDTYKDRTGNLRSSIGYVVVVNGNIVQASSFRQVKNGSKGSSDGERYARQLADKFPKGICLIVVAGMNYAGYVSARGYDVLDSSELLAERLVPQMLRQLGLR